eukprot:2034260-Amphidinium_carterae.1
MIRFIDTIFVSTASLQEEVTNFEEDGISWASPGPVGGTHGCKELVFAAIEQSDFLLAMVR